MKYLKALLLISCLFPIKVSMAQGNNLQFNQAIYNTINGTSNPGFNGDIGTVQSFTVPPNKVWKIESAGAGYRPNYPFGTGRFAGGTLAINNTVIFSCPTIAIVLSGLPILTNLPIWLPSGNYDLTLTENGGTSSSPLGDWKGFISGIEYNIVP